jgi:hypothetical protein
MADPSFALTDSGADTPAAALPAPLTASRRADGWSPDRQRAFLEGIADGQSVEAACRAVGLSVASAYAFRRRAAGAAFALGWRAAILVARDIIADRLLARALEGQEESWTRADGSIGTRRRFDNRLAMALLARLDRLAEAPPAEAPASATACDHQAARLVAQDFDAFLALVEAEGGPAHAGLFLAARDPQHPQLSCHEADETDADEAAPEEDEEEEEREEDPPVWRDYGEWRTWFAPPPGAEVEEYGRYGSDEYIRGLTPREEAVAEAREAAAMAALLAEGAAVRDAWFGFVADGG